MDTEPLLLWDESHKLYPFRFSVTIQRGVADSEEMTFPLKHQFVLLLVKLPLGQDVITVEGKFGNTINKLPQRLRPR